MAILIGLDLGQRSESTGLCVAEHERRSVGSRQETHFVVRHLERLPMGTPYPQLAKRACEVAKKARARSGRQGSLYLDATGLGDPIVDLVRAEVAGEAHVVPVYFTFGDRRVEEGRVRDQRVILGKAWLVSRLQVLLQTGCLHLPRTSESETLARELLEYEIRVDEQANDRYGAFRVGRHDDLVTALGLAVQPLPRQVRCGQAVVGAWG